METRKRSKQEDINQLKRNADRGKQEGREILTKQKETQMQENRRVGRY